MSARLRFGLTLGLLTAVAAAWACGDGTSTGALTLKAFHRLKAEKDGCTFSKDEAVLGQYDVGLATQGGGDFSLYIKLQNNLESNEDLEAGRLNTNKVKVSRVEIEFDRLAPWDFLPAVIDLPTGVVVDTGEDYYVPIPAITQAVAAQIDERPAMFERGPVRLRFTVKAYGELFDGTKAESNDLSFGVDVYRGAFVAPCPGGKVEGLCSSWAQPDGWACGKADSDGGGGSGGDGGGGGGGSGGGGA